MERIFVGIKLSSDVASKVSQLFRKRARTTASATTLNEETESITQIKGVRWVEDRNIHLTLKFLDEFTVEQRKEVETSLASVIQAPYNIKLANVTSSPVRGPIRSIHVCLEKGDISTCTLKKKIDYSLQPFFSTIKKQDHQEEDDYFHPHITIGRVGNTNIRHLMQWISRNKKYNGPEMTIESFQLMKSENGEYQILAEYPLTGEKEISVETKSDQVEEHVDSSSSGRIGSKRHHEKDKKDEVKTDEIVSIPVSVEGNKNETDSQPKPLTTMERIFIGIKLKTDIAATVSGSLYQKGFQQVEMEDSSTQNGGKASTSISTQSVITTTTNMKGVKWIKDNNLHLTLRFIGEVTTEQRQEFQDSLSKVEFDAFEMKLARVGNFPKRGPVRIIYVGVERGDLAVRMLKKAVDESIQSILTSLVKNKGGGGKAAGKSVTEDDFQTHITIARVGYANNQEVKTWISSNADYDGPEMMVDSFQLFKSTLTSSGSEYEVLAEYPLNLSK